MKVGDVVTVRRMKKVLGKDVGTHEWRVVFERGTLTRDYMICIGINSLYEVELDSGTSERVWSDQLDDRDLPEVVKNIYPYSRTCAP